MANACLYCNAGEYSATNGSLACEQCPAGTASDTVGADNDAVCEVRERRGQELRICCWGVCVKENKKAQPEHAT